LTGGLVVDYFARAANRDRCIEVRLEVEVKTIKGRIREDQALRQAAFTQRGGVYILTRSIADCIAQLVAARERIRTDLL
jgi:HJR/Mrr/RecB family endonuclease